MQDYERFLHLRNCPSYRFKGTTAIVSDEYAKQMGMKASKIKHNEISLHPELFDYQADISKLAIQKQKHSHKRCEFLVGSLSILNLTSIRLTD
jgi:hypothetical protein